MKRMRKNSKADYLIITWIRGLHIWHDFTRDVLSVMQNKNTKDTNILHLSALNQTDCSSYEQKTRCQTASEFKAKWRDRKHYNDLPCTSIADMMMHLLKNIMGNYQNLKAKVTTGHDTLLKQCNAASSRKCHNSSSHLRSPRKAHKLEKQTPSTKNWTNPSVKLWMQQRKTTLESKPYILPIIYKTISNLFIGFL